VKSIPKKGASDFTALAGSDSAHGRAATAGSQASLNSFVSNTGESNHLERERNQVAHPSSTLAKSMNSWRVMQRRSFSENRKYLGLRIHRIVKQVHIHWRFTIRAC
jgi:hypothetical protein